MWECSTATEHPQKYIKTSYKENFHDVYAMEERESHTRIHNICWQICSCCIAISSQNSTGHLDWNRLTGRIFPPCFLFLGLILICSSIATEISGHWIASNVSVRTETIFGTPKPYFFLSIQFATGELFCAFKTQIKSFNLRFVLRVFFIFWWF